MANISPYLSNIKSAVYGSEVRDSIHDAIQAMNEQAELSQNVAVNAQNSAAAMAQEASDSAYAAGQSATDAANSATAAAGSVTTAQTIAEQTARSIAAEEIARIIANAPESYDTLKEIADWISDHEGATVERQVDTVTMIGETIVSTNTYSTTTTSFSKVDGSDVIIKIEVPNSGNNKYVTITTIKETTQGTKISTNYETFAKTASDDYSSIITEMLEE